MSDESPSFDVRAGDVIAGKYRVERVLGRGAMGVVVAAMHLELHELRAIKFMSDEALAAPEALERFLREARAAARLKSQHVTKVHDVGRLDSGAPYIVMEYLEGADLRVKLKKGGPLSVDEAVLYVAQACEALAEAHEAGIVHRDIKPGNLFLSQGVGGAPCIKVVDFGIAKLVHGAGAADGRDLTATAAVLGTPKFMSPEQMRADRAAIDARSDLWALGVTLYQLLTRKMPFAGDSIAALCSAILWNDFTPASKLRPDLPAGLDAVIARCLAKDASSRYQTAIELATALLPFGSDEVQRVAPIVHTRALAAAIVRASGVHAAVDPTTATGDSALAAGTAAPWAKATTPPRPAPRTRPAARIAGVAGFLFAGLVAAGVVFTRSGVRPAAPLASAAPSETAPSPVVEPPPPATGTAAATMTATPTATAAPAPSGAAAVEPPLVVADAGAPSVADAGVAHARAPAKVAPGGSAHPGGKSPKAGESFWQSRK